ncbi:MAG TPA: hypothetical protein VHW96_05730 [Solirubrobacteraceae bacterium]|jgi:hypothetical protein|nr:hypothetical protein [Solirubrobacteraceae bacterium]
MPEKSLLDARLAEIDRRLRTIQSGLKPAAEAAQADREAHASPVVPPEAAPVPKRLTGDAGEIAGLVAQLMALVEAHERLLSCARDVTERRAPAAAGPSLSVSAGPFASTEALRRFERALQSLPEVRSAVVREYEGADRAIVDVHLSEPTP